MTSRNSDPGGIGKCRTGIPGFDAMTGGGIPEKCSTLVMGEAGAGKTVFALQSLVGGARDYNEPAIFVAFEEHSSRIVANAGKFGWNLPEMQEQGLFFLDAQPDPHLIQSGEFGLEGMLNRLDTKIKELGARRVAFDAIDVVLSLIDDPVTRKNEILRLNNWLARRGVTTLITSKLQPNAGDPTFVQLDFMQFMVDCFIRLHHESESGVSQRSLRIVKYRGSAFEENQTPFIFGDSGIEIAHAGELDPGEVPISTERVSTGIDRLDTMLDGGYHRASTALITGSPGTAKTTVSGAFAQAACERGENTLLVSFDSPADELIRNLASINLDLDTPRREGTLQIMAAHSIYGNSEQHLMQIRQAAESNDVRCMVIDPLSALAPRGDSDWSKSVVERLIDWCKARGITLVCTSLLDQKNPVAESTPLQISTIADTWIHLNYQINAGERNRGLTIVKSRGTGHSNQVRELILSDEGITLEDVYTAGGEVLMGTLRYEREASEAMDRKQREAAQRRQRLELENEEAELRGRLQSLERELAFKQEEIAQAREHSQDHETEKEALHDARLKKRGADTDQHSES